MWWQPKACVHQAFSSLWLQPEIIYPTVAPLVLSHCRQQRTCLSKCWAICPISVNTDDSLWKQGKTKSETWHHHKSRSQKLKRICWNSFGRQLTQHLRFPLWFVWTLTEIFGHVHELFPLSLPTTPCHFHFSTCMRFGFCPPAPPTYASWVPNYKEAWSLWSGADDVVHCVLSLCCTRLLWLLPLSLSWVPYENSPWNLKTKQQNTIFLQFLNIMKIWIRSRFRSQTCRERVSIFNWICSWNAHFGMSVHIKPAVLLSLTIQFSLFPFSVFIRQSHCSCSSFHLCSFSVTAHILCPCSSIKLPPSP